MQGLHSSGLVFMLGTLLLACTPQQDARSYGRDSTPDLLSQWQLMSVQGSTLQLDDDVMPYDLATPLFSDYAMKLRTLWLPDNTQAKYTESGSLEFPVGTVISKTFYYPTDTLAADDGSVTKSEQSLYAFVGQQLDLTKVRLIETRLLVRQTDGWQALPYVWNEQQTDAELQITGAVFRLAMDSEPFAYVVPNRNECASCHVLDQNSDELSPIGPSARNLNRLFAYSSEQELNQLQALAERDWLSGLPAASELPAAALWSPGATDNLEHRARSYLDVNCGHCHQRGGSGDTSGLFLDYKETSALAMGVCKPPVAAGRGAGGHRYSIVPGHPEQSILSYRIESQEVGVLMPEVGRSLTHDSGLALINEWIRQQSGQCNS
ncbi:SO2930 family diheme c-type cytochrome [Pseudohongiella spirulinae]|uniref:SO2930 family diheme c-type cytochrome n=1 Tax=Pseudohongiella spirulinae TaxID=1249552 RepID=UPI0007176341|nr:SO2930 family diheme c-type cytochrome [Pseudohongiella spirulinae]